MTSPAPPDEVCYDLDEAMTLLGDLEDAELTYTSFDLFAGVVTMRAEVLLLHRKLALGGADD